MATCLQALFLNSRSCAFLSLRTFSPVEFGYNWPCLGPYCSLHEHQAPILQYMIDELLTQLFAESFFLTNNTAVFMA